MNLCYLKFNKIYYLLGIIFIVIISTVFSMYNERVNVELEKLEKINNNFVSNLYSITIPEKVNSQMNAEKFSKLNEILEENQIVSSVYRREEYKKQTTKFDLNNDFKQVLIDNGLVDLKDLKGNVLVGNEENAKGIYWYTFPEKDINKNKVKLFGICNSEIFLSAFAQISCEDTVLFSDKNILNEFYLQENKNRYDVMLSNTVNYSEKEIKIDDLKADLKKETAIDFIVEKSSVVESASANQSLVFTLKRYENFFKLANYALVLFVVAINYFILLKNEYNMQVLNQLGKKKFFIIGTLLMQNVLTIAVGLLVSFTPLYSKIELFNLMFSTTIITYLFWYLIIGYKLLKRKREQRNSLENKLLTFFFCICTITIIFTYSLLNIESKLQSLANFMYLEDPIEGRVFVGLLENQEKQLIDDLIRQDYKFVAFADDGNETEVYNYNYPLAIDLPMKNNVIERPTEIDGKIYKQMDLNNPPLQIMFKVDGFTTKDYREKLPKGTIVGVNTANYEELNQKQAITFITFFLITSTIIFDIIFSLNKRTIFVLKLLGKKTSKITDFIYKVVVKNFVLALAIVLLVNYEKIMYVNIRKQFVEQELTIGIISVVVITSLVFIVTYTYTWCRIALSTTKNIESKFK